MLAPQDLGLLARAPHIVDGYLRVESGEGQLRSDRDELDEPGEVTLSWVAEDATTVLLSDRGRVPAGGTGAAYVDETTTFVLTAFDAARGRVACDQVTVTVQRR